jgi:hypothetical protein
MALPRAKKPNKNAKARGSADGQPAVVAGLAWHMRCSIQVVNGHLPSYSANAISSMGAYMTPDTPRLSEDALRRVQGEFLEMPGLRLTEPQARRLWGLDASSCAALLRALVDAKFLFRTRDGAFMRLETSSPVKAGMRSTSRIAAA